AAALEIGECHVDGLDEGDGREWPGEDSARTKLDGVIEMSGDINIPAAGRRDDHHTAGRDFADHVQPIALWHEDIGDHHVGLTVAIPGESLVSIVGHEHGVPNPGQYITHGGLDAHVVFDHQDSCHSSAHSLAAANATEKISLCLLQPACVWTQTGKVRDHSQYTKGSVLLYRTVSVQGSCRDGRLLPATEAWWPGVGVAHSPNRRRLDGMGRPRSDDRSVRARAVPRTASGAGVDHVEIEIVEVA